MEINGYKAIIQYDLEIEMFRGEFVDLNGGADFYAKDVVAIVRSPNRLPASVKDLLAVLYNQEPSQSA